MLPADDEERLQQAMLRIRGIGGAATLAVCSTRRVATIEPEARQGRGTGGVKFRGADAVASWERLSRGEYGELRDMPVRRVKNITYRSDA